MKRKHALQQILLTSLCFTVTTSLPAQPACGCEEAEQLRAPMGRHFNSGQLDSAAYYASKLLQFKEPGCAVFYQDWMAQIAIGKKDITAARTFLTAEEKLLKQHSCGPDQYVRHYNTLSKLYQELNKTDSFVIACLQCSDAARKANDFFGLSRASADLASAFSMMGQEEKAIHYYYEAMEAAGKQQKVPTQLSLVQIRLGDEYLQQFERTGKQSAADSALFLCRQALDTTAKYKDLIGWLEANQMLADHALFTGRIQEAIPFAEAIIQNSPRGIHLLDRLLFGGYSRKSEALFKLKQYKQAELFADSALLFAQSFNPLMMITAYEKIAQAAKANGNTAKSLQAFEKKTALKDSLFSLEKNTAITELERKYSQAKNENRIKELGRKKQFYLLLAIAGFIGLIAVVLFLRQQSLKHKKNILETEQRLNRARMNPHFFFNALTTLQKFALRENDGQAMASNLSKFSNIMRETLESTYKDYITIEQEIEFLTEYLEVQKIRFPKTFVCEIQTSPDLEPHELVIPSMILQPFVENSIEHGFSGLKYPGRISILFSVEGKELRIEINDNGKGLAAVARETSEHISRAGQIIKDRIYLLNIKLKTNARFSITGNPAGPGVQVIINLPLLAQEDVAAKK